ncbi:helix-turn-helix domain-containing protein [Pseudomonas sp. ok266]|uniref:helix-turn-helix domain-containing protein n=1 Tax=Pseudomonas sp. ok266 TaxID=1761896 RepID=UPI0008D4D52D|nr:helix-turn-helix domain-containing protein [Pseudomonas sp. ok266]SEN02335.1 Helix-turn-helix domain-containing protein [Pseudomonas sp. ok266]
MDHVLLMSRLAAQLRIKRRARGLTQAQLADLARVTRYKVIAIEKGALSVGMNAYARVIAALDCELTVIPAVMPALEEVAEIFV